MSAPALRPLGIGEILDVSLKIAWRNLGTLVRIVLVVVAPAQALIALINVSAVRITGLERACSRQAKARSNATRSGRSWRPASARSDRLPGEPVRNRRLLPCGRRNVLGRKATWRESLRFAARRFPSILLIVTLGGILTVIGFVFCVIPGIYLAVAFAVALRC